MRQNNKIREKRKPKRFLSATQSDKGMHTLDNSLTDWLVLYYRNDSIVHLTHEITLSNNLLKIVRMEM